MTAPIDVSSLVTAAIDDGGELRISFGSPAG